MIPYVMNKKDTFATLRSQIISNEKVAGGVTLLYNT
jgi:hypothetical protein